MAPIPRQAHRLPESPPVQRALTSTDVPKLRQMPQGPAHLSVLIRSGFTLSDPFNRLSAAAEYWTVTALEK
jgi:hypothetical protein